MHTALVFNVQRFSLHDGPGLRSTVFMKGCPLRCAWCHNPESQSPRPEFVRLRHRCMRCGRCSDEELAGPVVSGRDARRRGAVPDGRAAGRGRDAWTSAALVQTLLRDRIFFDESGGGVTFSGGEPLMQAAFVTEALRRLRAEGRAHGARHVRVRAAGRTCATPRRTPTWCSTTSS